MVKRSRRFGAIAGISILLLASACSGDDDSNPDSNGETEQVTYVTNFGLLGRDGYAFCADENDSFAERDITVEIQPGTGTEDNLALLLGGQAQFTTVDLVGGAIAAGNGVEGWRAIAAIQQNTPAAWMTINEDIQSPRDLEGHTIGLPAGAVTGLMFPTYAELAGIDQDRVTVENVAPPDLGAALGSGQVDAVGQFVVGEPLMRAQSGGADVTVFPFSDYVPDLYGVALVTTTELIEENPSLVERFRDGLLEGLEFSLDNPEECANILAEHQETANPEIAAAEMALMEPYARLGTAPVGALDSQRLAQMIATLEGAGAIPAGLTPEDLADFDMARQG